ncbi:MAG: class I SAM-dependent rRNA methyltransferase [Chloroflexi bacterium]|uniref:Class I SAM-dependent rRNA methyltransferase n=1 Tax=Candidatus Chlorohelix allophototropha TaxID=3003348 RepID=A0A8T7M5S8_9CHLR|nr:class I SAM-dependent rRNA methyltransferase [Chloroflexota bacterium]WJW69392.1 class I SAM-dependent rRNA methyltransferase [Chloroflexota bacterium L227-S17]
MSRLFEVTLPASLRPKLAQGHPWVYREAITQDVKLPSGAWVKVRCGNFSAFGLWDNSSAIAIRIFSQHQVPDAEWLQARVQEAWENRAPIRERQQTTAYRWLFGEGDGLPGITVDLYGQFAVIQTYAESLETLKPMLIEALCKTTKLKGVLERWRGEGDEESPVKSRLVWGNMPPRNLVITEHGLRFRANLFEGQKTGLFLDHRENRRLMQDWCSGKKVLNLFSYTGAFSVYAARGGAAKVVSCDIAAAATADARQNFELNGFDAWEHDFLSEDCFELLTRFVAEGQKFDIVILDPPSFAHNRKNVYAALRGYEKLNRLALQCVAPGGLLATASCTAYVSPDMFRDMLAQAAMSAGKRLLLQHDAGQPLDHPVPVHFMEGRYLKFVLARVLDIP